HMARLHEYQGKAILAQHGIRVPRGRAISSPQDAATVAAELGECVLKIQAWTTGRAAIGGVAFAKSPGEASTHAARLLSMTVGQFPVTSVLVEEKISIAAEFFVSLSVDDAARAPVILIAAGGGTGIEDRAAQVKRIPCSVSAGPDPAALAAATAAMPGSEATRAKLAAAITTIFNIAKATDARSIEINPLVVTSSGELLAADCRMTIDDYAVFRHPELGIDFPRELDHPPTPLEKLAFDVEQQDHRGTFFFAQMNTAATPGSKGLIGFHGAGGGGSMMSMDAITNEGFTIANFCDTSGNPSPAKVYRAARVILSQPNLVGYFGSGSGVANQEQYWSAYGLAKAFWEMDMPLPTVIRLGGNTEDRAVEILQHACKPLPGIVEGYKKTDPPAKIARRFAELVADAKGLTWSPRKPRVPAFVNAATSHRFAVKNGTVWIDAEAWKHHAAAIISRCSGLLRDDGGKPALTVKPEELMNKDSEMIACEVECRRDGIDGFFVQLPIAGLETI
ncbi:MAG: ATP-grasp domain-containing protein, partial [Phycisphaerales bacterium]